MNSSLPDLAVRLGMEKSLLGQAAIGRAEFFNR